MNLKLLPLALLISMKPCRGSLVIDSGGQTAIHWSDYCPSMKYCREGTHVMCMYYNPKSEFGPHCLNHASSENSTVTAEIAGQILDVVNAFRSKIARGNETGADNKPFPRGYGMFRLKWDSELATFAQVMAKQCILIHDLCRATKRFPSPIQTSAMYRLAFPDWGDKKYTGDKVIGFTKGKMIWAITKLLQSWYLSKFQVTEEMIKVCPGPITLLSNQTMRVVRTYLSLIQGSATHMGCGISAYTDYTITTKVTNNIQLICNLSAGLRKGVEAYEMTPPIPGLGYSPKCGCPPGSEEDEDCLCNEVNPPPPPEPTCPYGENSGNDCQSTLVLLPIFTMEDAPTDKLFQVPEQINPLKNYFLQRVDNTSDMIARQGNMKHTPSPLEMFDFFHENEGEAGFWQRARQPMFPKSPSASYTKELQESPVFRVRPDSEPPPPPPRRLPAVKPSPPARSAPRDRLPPPPPPLPPPRIPPPPPPGLNSHTTSLHHEETRPATSLDKRSRPLPKQPPNRRAFTKKASIFSRVAQFELPSRRSMPTSPKVIKKDVEPRKDFSNLSKVVNDYLKRQPGYKIIENKHESEKPADQARPRTQSDAVVIDTGLNKAEETVINFNQYLSPKNNSNYNDKDVDIKDDNDNKLLSLLDTLEREVRHIALDGSEKELFDAKIRKIYGSIIGKAAVLKFPKPILLSTTDQETPEIDFGETRSSVQIEPDQEETNHIKVPEKPRQPKRYQMDKAIGRVTNSLTSIQGHKWKNKFIDSFDQKKYKENIDGFSYTDKRPDDTFDHKYHENLDHTYGDIDHKHMDDLDHTYNENINKKYNENHLEHEYNDDQVKLSDNFHRQHRYNLDKKYNDDDDPASSIKYIADRAVFREFEHNSRSSQEDTTARDFSFKALKGTPDIALITKDREKRKKNERKHRNRAKSLNSPKDPVDPLGLERRKYYQEKLDSIRRKLRNRKNRGNSEPGNERSLRRMHTKNRETGKTRSKSQADSFYMPERARFLHGF